MKRIFTILFYCFFALAFCGFYHSSGNGKKVKTITEVVHDPFYISMLKHPLVQSIREFDAEGKLIKKSSFSYFYCSTGCDSYDSTVETYLYNAKGKAIEIIGTDINHTLEDKWSDTKVVMHLETYLKYDEKGRQTDITIHRAIDPTTISFQPDTDVFGKLTKKQLNKAKQEMTKQRVMKGVKDTIAYHKTTHYNSVDSAAIEEIYDNLNMDNDISQSASGSKHVIKIFDTAYPYSIKCMISLQRNVDTSFADLFRLLSKFDSSKATKRPGIFVEKNDTLMWCYYKADENKNPLTKTIEYGYDRYRKYYYAFNYDRLGRLIGRMYMNDQNKFRRCGWGVYDCSLYQYGNDGKVSQIIKFFNGFYDSVTCRHDLLWSRDWYFNHVPKTGRDIETRYYNADDSLIKIVNTEPDLKDGKTDSTVYLYTYYQ